MTLKERILENRAKCNIDFTEIDEKIIEGLTIKPNLRINVRKDLHRNITDIETSGDKAVFSIKSDAIDCYRYMFVLINHLQSEGLQCTPSQTGTSVTITL